MGSNSNDQTEGNLEEVYCFVRINYRNLISVHEINEYKILQNDQIIYKGCLKDEESFTFKSIRNLSESSFKLEIYRNDIIHDEIISCCEYGFMDNNLNDSFQVVQILGCKPCQKCQSISDVSYIRQLSKASENPMIESSEETTNLYNSRINHVASENPIGPPQLSPMSSLTEHTFPSSYASTLSLTDHNTNLSFNQNQNTQSLNGTNDFMQLLSSFLYNSMFRMADSTETQSRISREKGNVEWFNLIYLHKSWPLDPSVIENIRRLINIIKTFDDPDECIAYINSLTNRKVILILSDDFVDSFLPRIEDDFSISSIYILSENPERNSTFYSNQIQGIHRSMDEIYEMLTNEINPMKLDLIDFQSVYVDNTKLNPEFLFFRVLCETLVDSNETENAFDELIHFARQEYEGNEYELAEIENFERNYKNNQALSWLFRPCFLFKMLHRALFVHEVDVLYKFRSFIQDINTQIAKENLSEPISVYLGNTIEQSEIVSMESFRDNQNLITFQQLLFASTNQSQAITRAKNLPRRNNTFLNLLVRIDFPSSTGFVSRIDRHLSSQNDGINILISAGLITKIITIDKDYQKNGYILIHLQFVSIEDQVNLQEQLQIERKQIQSTSPLFQIAKLLLKVNYQTIGEEFFSNLLNEDFLLDNRNRQNSIGQSLELFAINHFQIYNFKRASELFSLCLKAYYRFLPKQNENLYLTYRDLGDSLFRIGEYQLAIDNYQLAFAAQRHSNNPNLSDSALCYYKSGLAYLKQGHEQNAIQALDHAEKILKQSDKLHHVELISIYETLADYYFAKNKLDDVIISYKKIVVIYQSVQPHDSKELYTVNFIIGGLYLKVLDYANARIYYERAFDYGKEYLPEKHHTFVVLHNNIGYGYYQQEQYSKALYHYSNGLSLASECEPENSPLIGTLLSNTALVYSNTEKFDQAIKTMEKAIEHLCKTLPNDDEEVTYKRTLLDGIKRKKILYESPHLSNALTRSDFHSSMLGSNRSLIPDSQYIRMIAVGSVTRSPASTKAGRVPQPVIERWQLNACEHDYNYFYFQPFDLVALPEDAS
ncbi:hypothetical protein I4U23_005355 [Adineta vaga]|nr:hypothetical protein I4U23_005355 [Adineta vaga]